MRRGFSNRMEAVAESVAAKAIAARRSASKLADRQHDDTGKYARQRYVVDTGLVKGSTGSLLITNFRKGECQQGCKRQHRKVSMREV